VLDQTSDVCVVFNDIDELRLAPASVDSKESMVEKEPLLLAKDMDLKNCHLNSSRTCCGNVALLLKEG